MAKSEVKVRIGVLGGTFDPIHLGHLELAKAAKNSFGLDKILFVPAFIPPHKQPWGITDPKLRLEMLALALSGKTGFEISRLEIEKKEVSYSVDTVTRLKQDYPEAELFFIVGSDALAELKTWKRVQELLSICNFVIARRPGHSCRDAELPKKSIFLDVELPDISSRMIREHIRSGAPVANLLPEDVYSFITRHKLYRG